MDLPLSQGWTSDKQYVESLLSFATSSDLFRHLCGGVHILDFLTSKPDLFTQILPPEWRAWFELVEIWDVLRCVLHEEKPPCSPPASLEQYVRNVRSLCLRRDPAPRQTPDMPRHIAVGMKPKKTHEVSQFSSFVSELSKDVSRTNGNDVALVDFGSGQNYLGRTLACPPYNKHVIAIEKKHHNVQGARGMDVHAKLTKKEKVMRNKKEYKKKLAMFEGLPTPPAETDEPVYVPNHVLDELSNVSHEPAPGSGSMTYIEHNITDGNLALILDSSPLTNASIPTNPANTTHSPCGPPPITTPPLMTISLHSCGNLSHHALRSLTLTPSVTATAIIGCCYNLLTERLGPQTYKLPTLRPNHPRLSETGNAYDPHGFPMSRQLENYPLPEGGQGVRLNITARMMAVQAPGNWGREDSEIFFTRHFYRALLQRILLDLGVVKQATSPDHVVGGNSLSGKDGVGTPLIVGSLRKSCFESFRAYVHGALAKLAHDPEEGEFIKQKTKDLSDEVIDEYEQRFSYAKKRLSIIWTLMAFSAGVVESVIVVDRWLWCKEQECVERAWVQPVFNYALSPRNLCVVAVKKKDWHQKVEVKKSK